MAMVLPPDLSPALAVAGAAADGAARPLFPPDRFVDVPGNVTTMAQLEVGLGVLGSIDFVDDQDWFRFSVEAGLTYVFIQQSEPATPDLDSLLRLFDADGDLLEVSSFGPGFSSQIVIRPTADAEIFVAAGAFFETTGSYILSAQQIDDIPGDPTTTAVLPFTQRIDGRIDFVGDEDWFQVEVGAAGTSRFTLIPDDRNGQPLQDGRVLVYDADGFFVAEANADAQGRVIGGFEADGPTTFFVAAGGPQPGDYIFDADRISDVRGDAATSAELPFTERVDGRIDFSNDVDWFKVEVGRATSARFTLLSDAGNGDPLRDGVLLIVDADGFTVGQINGDGTAPIVGGIETDGPTTLFVAVSGQAVGDFTLDADRIDDVRGDLATTAALPFTELVDGSIDFAGDADWFRVDVTGPEITRFSLTTDVGVNAPLGEGFSQVTVFDAAGNLLVGDFSEDGLAVAGVKTDGPTTLFVAASASLPGAYTLDADRIDELPADATLEDFGFIV